MTSLFKVIKADYLYLSPPRVIASRRKIEGISNNGSIENEPEAVIAETELLVQQLLNEAREKAENIISGAQVEAEELINNANQKVCEMEQEAQKAGYEAGFQSGQEALAGEREQLKAEITRQQEAMVKERNILIKQLEPEIIQLAVMIARCVIHTELEIAPEQVKAIAEAVLAKAQGDRELVLKVSSRDYDLISSLIQEGMTSDARINVVVDNSQTMGCQMETPFGEIDASIEGQLQEVVCELLEVSRK